LHQVSSESSRFFANYIRTYIERDVRLLKNNTDLFLSSCSPFYDTGLAIALLGIEEVCSRTWLSLNFLRTGITKENVYFYRSEHMSYVL